MICHILIYYINDDKDNIHIASLKGTLFDKFQK